MEDSIDAVAVKRKWLWSQPHYVYALVDPLTEKVRYIGMSHDPWKRLCAHRKKPATPEMKVWIRGLWREHSLIPKLVILATASHGRTTYLENQFICEYAEFHGDLFNKDNPDARVPYWRAWRESRYWLKQTMRNARREVFPLKERPASKRKRGAYPQRLITFNGETMCSSRWAARLGISKQALWQRLRTYAPQVALSVGRKAPGDPLVPRELMKRAGKDNRIPKTYKQRNSVKFTQEERKVRRARMAEMVFSGFTVEEVSSEFQVTTATVKNGCRENEVSV